MSIEVKIKAVLDDFENFTSEEILEILIQIKSSFKSELTLEYLEGKIQKIVDLSDEKEKKKQCKPLTPYLDWYLQGL